MKVLYIGNYNDPTGWGNAAKNNILAMHSAGVNVVPRCITYNQNIKYKENDIIKELESNSLINPDVCIQHVLPHLYSYNANMKNIGYLAVESYDFKDSMWHKYCNMMDEIWVPSSYCKESCLRSGVIKPIKIIPHCIDLNKYKNHKVTKEINELKYTFNFVFVGDFIERKNIEALIRAFHKEFHYMEPVNLFIKTSNIDYNTIKSYSDKIKRGLKLRKKYKEEIVITGQLPFEDYISVLKQCHCFVMPSRGEGFCIPALEAMSIGLPCIYTSGIGMDDFCVGSEVYSYRVPCFGGVSSLDYLYTANTYWMDIDIERLGLTMRSMFIESNTTKYLQRKLDCINISESHSFESIGNKIKESLQ